MPHNVKCFKRNLAKKIAKQFDISRLRLKHSWTKPAFTMGIYVVRPGCFWSPGLRKRHPDPSGPIFFEVYGASRTVLSHSRLHVLIFLTGISMNVAVYGRVNAPC